MSQPVWRYTPKIHSIDGDIAIAFGVATGGSTPSSGAFPAANDALFMPLILQQATLVKRLFSMNGATVSGNIDVGIYSEDGARIVSSGSVAQAGTTDLQFFDITDLMLGPGRYYLAVAMDNATGTLIRATAGLVRLQAIGMAKQASAFPLPATATFATVTATYLPIIGGEVRELF